MKRNMLAVAIGLAFSPMFAMPEGEAIGTSKLQFKFDKEHVKSWSEEGKKAGAFARDAFSMAETAVAAMLLTVAEVIAGTPSQEDFLTGYAGAWTNTDTGKSRKTDARAVFDAYARKETDAPDSKPFEYERIVGYEKEADGSLKKDGNKMPIPIKETKPAAEWLKEYEGDFKGFLQLAREIRNAGTGRQSQGTAVDHRAKKKVTDKQFAAVMESVPVMSINQAHATVVEATKQIAKMPDFELAILNEMELLCNTLKTSKQTIYLNAAASIIDVLNTLREEVRAAKAMAEEARKQLAGTSTQATGDLHKAPVPAEQAKKAA